MCQPLASSLKATPPLPNIFFYSDPQPSREETAVSLAITVDSLHLTIHLQKFYPVKGVTFIKQIFELFSIRGEIHQCQNSTLLVFDGQFSTENSASRENYDN